MVQVSVVMPFYQHHQYVEEALHSLKHQTFKDWELIIVDDESEPPLTSTALLGIDNWFIIHQKHSGPAKARNTGIALASGQYILPLDADDKIELDFIEKCLKVDADIVYVNWTTFGNDNKRFSAGEFERERLLQSNYIVNTALYCKKVWLAVKNKNGTGYDEDIGKWEDWLFWLEAMALGFKFAYLPEWLFWYHITPQGWDAQVLDRQCLLAHIQSKLERLYGIRHN